MIELPSFFLSFGLTGEDTQNRKDSEVNSHSQIKDCLTKSHIFPELANVIFSCTAKLDAAHYLKNPCPQYIQQQQTGSLISPFSPEPANFDCGTFHSYVTCMNSGIPLCYVIANSQCQLS
jgi:hypothetical protein